MLKALNLRNSAIFVVLLLLFLPVLSVLSLSIQTGEAKFYVSPLIPEYISNSIILMMGVSITTAALATSVAWLSTFFSFPGRKFIEVALLFPLAIPSYTLAYIYGYSLEYSGPIQSFIRELFYLSRDDYYFPNIRSLPGAILILSFSLYPYVYVFVKARFLTMCNAICVSRTLGLSSSHSFFNVAIPIARPAICASVALVLMEVLADFGTVKFLSIDTITTGIYQSWFLLHDYSTAARLSTAACVIAITLIALEKIHRRNHLFTEINSSSIHQCDCYNIGWHTSNLNRYLISFACSIPVIIGAIIPVIVLIYWALGSQYSIINSLLPSIGNSIFLASLTAIISVAVAFLTMYLSRNCKTKISSMLSNALSIGYAIPGAVIAVGILLLLGTINDVAHFLSEYLFNQSGGILLIGTISGLIYAYVFRFLAISMNSIEAGFTKINLEITWISKLIGRNHTFKIRNIYIPMLSSNIALAFILIFIDTIKELPITFIIRPFNFDTISIKTYELVADERFQDAASPSLIIILVNIISVIILRRAIGLHKRK